MKNCKKIAAITALAASWLCISPMQSTYADDTESAEIYGTCYVVHPYTDAQTGTVTDGSSEYLTLSDENGSPLYGSIAQVNFELANVTDGFQVIDITFGFDNKCFTYLSYDSDLLYGGALKRATLKTVTNAKQVYNKGYSFVKIVSSSLNRITDEGTIAGLNFFVPQGTSAGLYPLDITINNYGYKENSTEIELPRIVVNSGFISVPGCAENSNPIDFGNNSAILEQYIAQNNIDTTLDGIEGCSPMDIYWSQRQNGLANNSFQIGDIAQLELGLRGDANLDGVIDAKDSALIAQYSALRSSGATVSLNDSNENLALTLANINVDIDSNGACIDAKDAAGVAKFSALSSSYSSSASFLEAYVDIWTQIGFFGS